MTLCEQNHEFCLQSDFSELLTLPINIEKEKIEKEREMTFICRKLMIFS